uniref:Neuronal tyrosine-phosphorylated phosphoinositide-3-kinase adapter 1-like n=1 Tax=Paramormyrops kingsleyae TaxID=1676925 RepID=A0A3B3TB11_9TELE|nr:neuronal tyrosine-phosphorylated phosphoinositide-3-kinase adapter 1-like isoform X1 [Paramormyrops kingsleyae]XP_023650770.1 neuronal tyrosine-phosphorylated phosphoinositide-3-kinase adapter 1-like isoform X1 [Paramormyrops kingsleyae]XP_023650771.1 neuronal tyrosine-phosphorylated phosphoinositide-3-kinase adapter 1-like isoform X1 [Paramormyrops kingsleyae]
MNSGATQDVAVERFLQDIERRGSQLHCAVIGKDRPGTHTDMNLLYRKSRLDWRNGDPDSNKKSSGSKEPQCTVGKVRDLATLRRHFRMGFMTMPVSQDLSPCPSAMAPRSQSCHSVGSEGAGLENGEHPPTPAAPPTAGRRPPAKPKRHPNTRLSSAADPRGIPPDTPPPLPPSKPPAKHSHLNRKNVMRKSESGDVSNRKVPPAKPKRSPNTQLTFEPPPARVPPPATPLPPPSQETQVQEMGSEEPVYIEMVGNALSPCTATISSTPDSDSEQSEAIYEEMKYPLPEEAESLRQDGPPPPRSEKPCHASSSRSSASSLSHPASSSSSSKPKTPISISHSSPLPASSPSTPIPQTQRAPTPYLLPGSKPQVETSNKIPAPFPNLLQHRPPLLAFPQPAAASSGVGIAAKLGTTGTQSSSSLASTGSTSSSKLPVLQTTAKDTHQDKQQAESTDSRLGHSYSGHSHPVPGLRARSHSTPLPPSSHYGFHQHHHSNHHPSHYHQYRKADRELTTSHSMKLNSKTQSTSHLPKSEKREATHHKSTPNPTHATPSSRSLLFRSHTPHSLPAYTPPPSDSPLLWTYPSTGLRRPPAYDSLRGGQLSSDPATPQQAKTGGVAKQSDTGSLLRDGSVGGTTADEGPYWTMQRKMSFTQSSRDAEKDEGSRIRSDNMDTLLRGNEDEQTQPTSGEGAPSSGLRAPSRTGLPLPCQTFPSCHRNGELGRLGRSASTSGVRQSSTNMQRQFSLPRDTPKDTPRDTPREMSHAHSPPTRALTTAHQQQQLQQQVHLHLQYQHLAQLAQCQPPASGGAISQAQSQRDRKLLEVIERKRCLCKEIKAHRRPERSLCKQDSMPILPSWRRTPEPSKTGTSSCQRQQAVVWDTAI